MFDQSKNPNLTACFPINLCPLEICVLLLYIFIRVIIFFCYVMLPFSLTFVSRTSFYVFVSRGLCRIEKAKFSSIFYLVHSEKIKNFKEL